MPGGSGCAFCAIAAGGERETVVFEDERTVAFLDNRPLFPGHCLLIPKAHCETLEDLPEDLAGPLFRNTRLLAMALERAQAAEGSFVAINNRVSQSVPHLHIHVVPRRRKDGLRGFFWPRRKYGSPAEMEQVRDNLREAVARLLRE
jgi:histidine triad (HIT) family protein